MRWLMAAVIGMGILIVAGVAVLAVLLVQRMSSLPAPIASASSPPVVAAMLDEPAGTHIVSTSIGADRAALVLGGGGPDRVVIVDLRSGHVVGRVDLAR